jgi:hypothetical protein
MRVGENKKNLSHPETGFIGRVRHGREFFFYFSKGLFVTDTSKGLTRQFL